MFAWFIWRLSVVSTVLPLWIALCSPHAALGQEKETPRPAATTKTVGTLAVGSEVVLKSLRTPLDDEGRQVPGDYMSFWIEQIEGERVRIFSDNKSKRGWVRRDQVVAIGQAIDFFTAELAKDPKDTDALWTRARLWVERPDDDRALADYDQLIRLKPDYAPSYIVRSGILSRKGRTDQALADLDRAIGLDPKDGNAFKERSRTWAAKRDYRRAHADLDEAIRLRPADAMAWVLRSFGWRSEGNLDQAMNDLNEAVRLAPSIARTFVYRGTLSSARKEYDKAIADFNKAIKLEPNEAHAYYCRAQAWGSKHDRDKAIADYSEAIRLVPKDADYRTSRARAWSARGMHAEAIADFDEAIRLNPSDARYYVFRGNEWATDAIVGGAASDKAIADFNRAIELDPKFVLAYSCRALAWGQKREYAKMARDLESAVKLDDLDPGSHQALARLLATCKDAPTRDGKRAVEQATRACELSKWKDPDCLATLAAAHAETGDFPTAVKWETQAVKFLTAEIGFNTDKYWKTQDRLYLYRNNQPCRE